MGKQCGFGYRRSIFEDNGEVVLSAVMTLSPGNREDIRAAMEDFSARRREKQPLELPSAGSTFKRPKTGYAAAMIDEAGLKGFAVGGAQVSEKHAGFVVNRGGATFDDVIALTEHIKKTVFERTGVMLELEIKVIE